MNPPADPFAFLPGDSTTANEIRAFDWASTPLGPPDTWPAALRSMLATIFDTPLPMFICAQPGMLFFFNDPYRPMLGQRLSGAIGKRFDVLWSDVWEDVRTSVIRALDGKGSMHRDMPLSMHRHGFAEETWWTFSYAPLRDENGSTIGMYAITNDVTRGVRSATALRELNASLEIEVDQRTRERDQIWAISPDLYMVMARDGFYRSANPAWQRELGYELHALVGLSFDELVHPDDLDRARDAVSQLIEGDDVDDLELRIRDSAGRYRWFAWTCVPDGDVIYAMGRDTQRRRDIEDQLRHAQKLEAIGRLTGGLAHDFNNILGGIGGAIEVVTERLESGRVEGTRRFLDAAAGAVQRAAGLTHRLLAYSRQQALVLSEVDANAIVHGLELLLKPLLGERINLHTSMPADLWRILSDAGQLESAILNLAINARDAMPSGGTLSIRTHNETDASRAAGRNECVVISVTDTGTGMAPDVIDKAFDPFFTTKAIGQGTGLGLSMVDGFARQTGGRALIESLPGAGTTVSLWLPRYRGEPGVAHAIARAHPRRGDGQHLVLVEDDAMLRALATEVLEEAGYRVSACNEAIEALVLLAGTEAVDLLVTDIGLPGMDGRQLALTARETRPELPILFMTGYAWDAFADSPQLPPRAALLSKPFPLAALADAAADLLDGTTA